MTIKQWFDQNFKASKPENEVTIDGMEHVGKYEFTRAYLPLDRDGSIFVLCGGQCIMAFELNCVGKHVVYLVVEPSRYRQDSDSRDRLSLHM